MRPVEILALLVAAFISIKLLVVIVRPKSWLSVVKTIYARPVLTMAFALIAAAVILKYLLRELSIIQIFAAMSFMMALMVIGVAAQGKEIIGVAEKILQQGNVIKKAWLCILIWICLVAWVFYALLA